MELVYLWVEDYKNIKKQGFDFSPRFECEFFPEYEKDINGKEKLKDNCKLIIKPKENYVEDFFGKNINITAIVGENGSGKTNLIKCFGNEFKINKIIICFIKNNIISINYPLALVNNKTKYEIKYSDDHFNNFIFLNKNFVNEITNNSVFRSLYLENNNLYLKYFDYDQNKSTLNINSYYKKIIQQILLNSYKTEFFNPRIIRIHFNDLCKEYLGSKIIKNKNDLEDLKYKYKVYLKSFDISETIKKDKILHTREMQKFLNSSREEILTYDYDKYEDISFPLILDKDENIYNFLNKYFVHKEVKLLVDKNFLFKNTKELEFFMVEEDIEIFLYLSRIGFLEYEFLDDKKSFLSLSSGEKSFFIDMVILSKEIKDFFRFKENNSLVLILDEPETTFHPKWQRKYINYLYQFLKNNFSNKQIHLIISSHSPFLLSDLPKENVILLEKDRKTGKCINVSSEIEDFNTFGANIHTLLSHGFFMKDGLIGEFAKEKINQVYNFITDNDTSFIKTKEEAQNIINFIGEPILKKELQFLYDQKFEVDDIDKQIREYEEAIKKLKSKKKKND
ncbi:AAA family ATPase [Aliarcobacter lanthieri]|uniref:AAA family ATPase n=1 Tax=Aliarcobacter lanthieri TaxID=1355374 RepID=UPI003AAC8C95